MRVRDTAGFTLVELLVVIVVLGIMSGVISTIMLNNLRESTLANTRQTLQIETQTSLDSAANDIRVSANADEANRWPDPNSPAGATNQYSWQSNSQNLVLATAAQNTSRDIIFADSKNYITEKNNIVYFVRNGTLYKRMLASPVAGNSVRTSCPANLANASCPSDRRLINNITNFEVRYLNGQGMAAPASDARSIELRLTTNRRLYGQDIIATYTTRMVFRND